MLGTMNNEHLKIWQFGPITLLVTSCHNASSATGFPQHQWFHDDSAVHKEAIVHDRDTQDFIIVIKEALDGTHGCW